MILGILVLSAVLAIGCFWLALALKREETALRAKINKEFNLKFFTAPTSRPKIDMTCSN